jgi:putative transposase
MKQLTLFRKPRKHAGGRPPNGDRAGVSHLKREAPTRHQPTLVTMRILDGVGRMRRQRTVTSMEETFRAARERFGMRIVHYSIQGNHLHLIVETGTHGSLSRGMQGLSIRIAKLLNRLAHRAGRVWADRFHSHVLKTRREVANALRYVLGNLAHHARQWGERPATPLDPFSSARFLGLVPEGAPVSPPRTWLLQTIRLT